MNRSNWIIILASISIGLLILYRAYSIPFTHDEASTWLNLRHANVWGCFFDPACWRDANNHWLNTVLLQFSGNIAGEEQWVLRMPNVIAGWLYILCAALLVTRYLKSQWSQLFGFLMLTLHFYLLDFFSLARGYGMMVAFIFSAVYCLLRYTEKIELKWLMGIIVSLILATLANFTTLISVAGIVSGWFIFIIASRQFNLIWNHGKFILLFSVGYWILFRIPLTVLSGSGEFEWGAGNIEEMVSNLFINLVSGAQLLRVTNYELYMWFIAIVLILCLIFFLARFQISSKPQLAISFLLLTLVFAFILMYQFLTDAKAPIGRKSIFLIPFLFTPLALSQDLIQRANFARIVAIIGSSILLIQFLSAFKNQINSSGEWYYDAYYPELLANIVPDGIASDSVKLGVSWIFSPSLTFYQQTQSLPIAGLGYQKNLVIDSSMNYYYVEYTDTTGFASSHFMFEKMIGPYYLFKKRHN